ncbi:tripartite tricarboxylate transporter substrate binding protein [Comamonas sp. NyZ500]|uniref:Bug family tripartite tricarboxylate transporter substrate binding protein n=1 Tax=Comamonas TaxID=283 RepID=UPI00063178F9|nr:MULTISPECIES: tripartite tricarboxylate transporter substrate binding protein [Comamonas]MBL5976975.1 tripartite tricarboxylate transporter substrate binding protein [Comamonas sp. NyZ500]UUE92418.1 tripartite tricarboxylate transporter substrate binding protein [Comamonas thiooxydans]BDB72101.1 ABC transporter substrate-binding protein [Comamonas thiooxydans]GAO73024.1 ABC transporter substrate-binding protein [Comamonas sp. E6]
MQRIPVLLSIALAAALPTGSAFAFTDKPVKLIVPAPPGGTIDVFARIISDQLAHELKQPVIVENRPGAGGAMAVKYMLSQPSDGNTLLVTVTNILTEVPHVLKGGFDAMKDVRPVSQMARSVMVFIASPQFPAKDAKEAIAYIKAHPGQLSFASYSQGTASQYAGAILNQKAGLDMQHVPFPGSAPALAQIMGNQIPLMFDGSVTTKPLVPSGKVRLLAVAYKSRLADYPQVPTMAELGYPELDFSNWAGVFASAKTPQPLLEKINATLQKVNASQAVQARYAATGFEPIRQERTLEQLSTDLQAEYQRNGEIVRNFGIKLN